MLQYVIRRLLQVVPSVLAILLATFVVIHVSPIDPEYSFASAEEATPEFLASLREKWGLDRPLPRQFLAYAANVLQGDLGESYDGQRVTKVIGERLPATLLLTGTAFVLSCVLGLSLGIVAARRRFGPIDFGVSVGSLLATALPIFFVAQLAILALAVRWRIFPLFGMEDQRIDRVGLDHYVDVAHHLMLPALILALSEVAAITRLTRAGLIEELNKEYARTARAKGVNENRVLSRHALPNAILPIVTVIGGRIGFLIAGAAIIETMFAWPGLGSLLVESSTSGNRPVVLGMVLLIAFCVLLVNLATDLMYARIDPRIRYE